MIRAIIISTLEGVIKYFNAGSAHGALEKREIFQHYGFTSRPLEGAEAIVLRDGNIHISVAEDDRRYRLHIEAGEVALYSDEAVSIRLKRGRIVEITAGTKVILTTPAAEISGNLLVNGNIEAVGYVQDSAGTMAAMRETYNGHAHTNPEGGSTGTPATTM